MSSLKKISLYICACLLLLLGVPTGTQSSVYAESAIKLQVDAGIGGQYKEAELVPLQVTITNNGPDIEGDLVLESKDGNEYAASYYQPVSISKGATKKVTLMVSGMNLSPSDVVMFKEGETEITRMAIGGQRLNDDVVLIGVIATDADTANFLGSLSSKTFSQPVRLVPLQAGDIPTGIAGLQLLNALVINNYSVDTFSAEQVQVLKAWTKAGGTLLLAGGPGYAKLGGHFADLSPVVVSGNTTVTSLTGLVKANQSKALELQRPFTISTGTIQQGTVLYQQAGTPLIALRKVGVGNVLYAAYDLAEEPLASWSGNGELWADVLHKSLSNADRNDLHRGSQWDLIQASKTYPSLQPPNFFLLAGLFGGYALFVGPILFLILRKKRLRSYVWGIAPGFSLIACFVIYFYGVYQHGTDVKLNTVTHVDLNQSGEAEAVSATSMFVPDGGDYEILFKNSESILPMNESFNGNGDQKVSQIRVNAAPQQSSVQFRDVEHWSMRSVLSRYIVSDAGKIESNLSYQNGALVGTLKNSSKFPLRDVKLLIGRTAYDIGTMDVGATVKVNVASGFSMVPDRRNFSRSTKYLLPDSISSEPDFGRTREFQLLQFVDNGNRPDMNNWQYPVKLIGWTDQSVVNVEVPEEGTTRSDLMLVTSDVELKPAANGSVFFPAGTFEPHVSSSTGKFSEDEEGFHIAEGDITFDFELTKEKLKIGKVNLFTWSDTRTVFDKQVYNWKTNTFDPYDKVFEKEQLPQNKLATYLSADGVLRIKFSHQGTDEEHLGTPAVSVEGWVVK